MTLKGRPELLAAKGRDAHHADVPVAPRLFGDPVDHVVVVGLVLAVIALGLAGSAQLAVNVDVAVGHEELRVATLDDSVPER